MHLIVEATPRASLEPCFKAKSRPLVSSSVGLKIYRNPGARGGPHIRPGAGRKESYSYPNTTLTTKFQSQYHARSTYSIPKSAGNFDLGYLFN